jgi:hypothetical protein
MNTCCLCLENKKLIKAHVVPRWAFMYLYPEIPDGDNRPLILVGKGKKTLTRPIGPYDSEILCGECDNFLGDYDNYGKKILLDAEFEPRSSEAYLIKNVNFEKLRIFILSVVWRAAISDREEFERVSIGPYENRLREVLLNCKNKITDPNMYKYSFIVGKFEEGELPENVVNKNVQIPHTQKISGINTAVIYIPRGLKIFIKLDKRDFTGPLGLLANYQKEGLVIPKLGNYSESDEFKALLNIFKNQSERQNTKDI